MSKKPTRQTTDGRAYHDLKSLAASTRRPTDELLQIYALEGFLERLTKSTHVGRFVLKGGMLLAAFDSRRPTRDVDLAAHDLDNDIEEVGRLVSEIAEIQIDDGLAIDATSITAQMIRDDDVYSGVRVNIIGTLATATLHFYVDVNFGDPIVPEPTPIRIPRLLGGDIVIIGYPIEMVLSEKIITALQRGVANTRWRDYVDISRLIRTRHIDGTRLVGAIRDVAAHRSVVLAPLAESLRGYSDVAQAKWRAWQNKQHLRETTPESFEELLGIVIAFADPALTQTVADCVWNPVTLTWIKNV
jgi:hypothetical protein